MPRGGEPVRRPVAAGSALVAALVLTTIVFDPRRSDPWPAVFLGWFAALSVAAWACRPVAARVVAVHAAALCLGLSGVERWLALGPKAPWEADPGEGPEVSAFYVRPDAATGFGPTRGALATASRRHEGRLIFDVTYRIGTDGFRITPSPEAGPTEGTVIVFGCSFAYGEGVRDEETLPWRIAERTGHRWTVRNEAFEGWGPHQMLGLLESGRALRSVPGTARLVILYETIGDHVLRALGRRPWSLGTPRYVAGPAGGVERRGSWGDPEGGGAAAFATSSTEALERSFTWRRILGSERRVAPLDLALVAAQVVRAREIVLAAFPSARFEILLWDERDPLSLAWRDALASRGFRVHDVSAILPGYPEDRRFQLPYDGHPTPAANDLLAAYVTGLLPAGPRR